VNILVCQRDFSIKKKDKLVANAMAQTTGFRSPIALVVIERNRGPIGKGEQRS